MAESSVLHLRDTISGVFGAMCLVATGAPFDMAKVRMQTTTGAFNGSFDCMSRTARQDGVLALWRGAGPALASSCIENAVVFTVNAAIHRVWRSSASAADMDPLSAHSLMTHAAIGGISGVFSATAICPAEVVKCRMQYVRDAVGSAAAQAQYRNGLACFIHIARHEGVRGCFAGLTPLLMRDVPFNTLFFGGYNASLVAIQAFKRRWRGDVAPPPAAASNLDVIIAGGIAGGVAWTAILPFDAVKSNMQVAAAVTNSGDRNVPHVQRSTWATACRLWTQGGVRAFYKGLPAALMRAAPANAALFWGVHFAHSQLEHVGM